MIVCVSERSGLNETYGIILAFGIAKPTIRLWFPNDLGLCLKDQMIFFFK